MQPSSAKLCLLPRPIQPSTCTVQILSGEDGCSHPACSLVARASGQVLLPWGHSSSRAAHGTYACLSLVWNGGVTGLKLYLLGSKAKSRYRVDMDVVACTVSTTHWPLSLVSMQIRCPQMSEAKGFLFTGFQCPATWYLLFAGFRMCR